MYFSDNFYCDICDQSFNCDKQASNHYASEKHKERCSQVIVVAPKEEPQITEKEPTSLKPKVVAKGSGIYSHL